MPKKTSTTKKNKKYTERGAAIVIPNDDYFSYLAKAFRPQEPDTNNDMLILEMASTRLRAHLGKGASQDLQEALRLINSVQLELNKRKSNELRNIISNLGGEFFLHQNRMAIGLIAFSAVDRDLAKLFRQLQSKAEIVEKAKIRSSKILDFLDTLNRSFLWQTEFLNKKYELEKRFVESHPSNGFSGVLVSARTEIDNILKLISLAAEESWDTSAPLLYGSAGKVSRPFFNRSIKDFELLCEGVELDKNHTFEVLRALGVKISETENTTVGLSEEFGSPISLQLKLKSAIGLCDLLNRSVA